MSGKVAAERSQKAILELAALPGNNMCADCHSANPRWTSWSLGIFICVHCASVHRKLGTHITKVKSLTLDTWSREQVEHMRANGNLLSNAKYNPDEQRFPPPANMVESERDSELEKYIRGKYEFKRFMPREPRAAPPERSHTTPAAPVPFPHPVERAVSQPVPRPVERAASQPVPGPSSVPPPPPPKPVPERPLWEQDLASLQAPVRSSTLPLQYQMTATPPMNIAQPTGLSPYGQGQPMGMMGPGMMGGSSPGMYGGSSPGMYGSSPGMMGQNTSMMSSGQGMMGTSPGASMMNGMGGMGGGMGTPMASSPYPQMQSQQTGFPGGYGQPFQAGYAQQPPSQQGSPYMQGQVPTGFMQQQQPQQGSPYMQPQVPAGFMQQQQQQPTTPYGMPGQQQQQQQQQFAQYGGQQQPMQPGMYGGGWQQQPNAYAGQTGWGGM